MIDESTAAAGGRSLIVAAVQTNPRLRATAENLESVVDRVWRAADLGAELVVFPECALTGYGYRSERDARADAETVPGPATARLTEVAAETGTLVAVGMIERAGDAIFNAAALIGPDGVVGTYRKSHLPFEAVDRFVSPGDLGLPIFETHLGRLGMLICYDLRFPEPARVMALSGAQIVLNLTNLPPPGWPQPEFMFQTRAAENRVWLVCADRVGTEEGTTYIGRSAIVSPSGEVCAQADGESETVITAEVIPGLADQKDLIVDPGVYELHLFRDRRTDLYGPLADHPGG